MADMLKRYAEMPFRQTPHVGFVVTALGVGNVVIYLRPADYERVRSTIDTTPVGQLARRQVILLVALCLAPAIGIEASQIGSAMGGTLFKGTKGLIIRCKETTCEQVVSVLLAILHYRETKYQKDEVENLALLSMENL